MKVHTASFAELDAATVYEIARLRVDVFVVEQGCCYPELDGRDREAGTVHVWAEQDGRVTAYLRVLREPGGGSRVGRVCTAVAARRRGLAGRLLRRALDLAAPPVTVHAQAHLADWYATLGFVPEGEPFLEEGIRHVAMRLP